MSGIAGIYHLDGQQVNPVKLAKMTSTLIHRGPDSVNQWYEGPVGLGHCLLWTTPESIQEKQPWVIRNGDLAITADARVDNRDELITTLELRDRPVEEITDSQLILAAYEKWGERCPEKIVGDFAFAIWNGRQKTVFCARDHFGIRPFYYYQSGQIFVFASEIKALLCLPEVPHQLDELRVGYHLAVTVEDKAITFYRHIRRLLPGHSMTKSAEGTRSRAFWLLDKSRELHFSADDEYVQAFRELFFEAVHCRLRSAFPIGSALSGGLDSSAVTCVARDLLAQSNLHPLHTVSAIFDETPQCDERPYIDAILSQGQLKPHFVNVDELSPLADLEHVLSIVDEPFMAPTMYLVWASCRTAHKQNIRILLDGLDGDTAVHHGDSYLAELARTGQWAAFAKEARAISRHENLPSVPALIRRYGIPYLTELARNKKWSAFIRETSGFTGQFGYKRRHVYWYCAVEPLAIKPMRLSWQRLGRQTSANPKINEIIHPAFAKRISLSDRIKTLTAHQSDPPHTARDEHYTLLTSGLIPYIFELADKISMSLSIESRHPFSDRRLVEFCLAVPPNQKLQQGWIRLILRRALADILPEKILWRGGKTVNSPAITAALLRHDTPLLEKVIMHDPGPLEPYVDITALRKIYQRYLLHQNRGDEMLIWQAVTLAQWLRNAGLAM